MSTQALARVFELKHLIDDPYAQLVLINLADNANGHGDNAFPSVPTMAQNSCMSERSVQRKLHWLEENGFIRRSDNTAILNYLPEYKRPTVWQICMDRDDTDRPTPTRHYNRKPRKKKKTETGTDATVDAATPAKTSTEQAENGDAKDTVTPGAPQTPDDHTVTGLMSQQSPKPSFEPNTPLSPKGDISPQGESPTKTTPTTTSHDGHETSDPGTRPSPQPGIGGEPDDDGSRFAADSWSDDDPVDGWRNEPSGKAVGQRRAAGKTIPDTDVNRLLDEFERILAAEDVHVRPLRERDRRAARQLIVEHGIASALDLAAWAAHNPFWRGKTLSVSELAKRWERLWQDRRGEAERRLFKLQNAKKARSQTNSQGDRKDPYGVSLVTSATATRCPVFGYSEFPRRTSDSRISIAQAHVDGLVPAGKCPLCAYDERNRKLHGRTRTVEALHQARKEADEQVERLKAQQAEREAAELEAINAELAATAPGARIPRTR